MARSDHLAERPPWLVRIPYPDGDRIAGAGMLVSRRFIVTCAHVVGLHAGRTAEAAGRGAAPAWPVSVEFPFADLAGPHPATIVHWAPLRDDGDGDVAVLRLERPVREVESAPLMIPKQMRGHRFSVHGFPSGDRAAREAAGTIRGASGQSGNWVQVDADGVTGWSVEHGFSGAPVYDHDAGAVVGIIALMDRHRSGHLLPVRYLRELWPRLPIRDGDCEPPEAEPERPKAPRPRGPVFRQAWAGDEPLKKYTKLPEPGGMFIMVIVAAGLILLAMVLQNENPDSWTYSTDEDLRPLRLVFVGIAAAAGWYAWYLRVEELKPLKGRMMPWSLTVDGEGVKTTGANGNLHFPWAAIESVVIARIGAHPLKKKALDDVFEAVHVKLRSGEDKALRRPAGWPVPAAVELKPGSAKWQVACVLGPLEPPQRKALLDALSRHAGDRLVDTQTVGGKISFWG
ncbi:S1 family peptidase [Glycomyces harbinensis]|uniref:Trypsin-like peptidase domain-containing protein n=1 Tax=Glycomyces harbinensis TaxID=58114 RepID=A0A1G6R5N7_9ACTN|nr:serine protease [Glycomyces harbinensis]SDC99226.1 Trypsin-like peptidase domain-containing protein [Glycomyces harbinensis]